MRTVSADVAAILAASPRFRARLQVKDSGGTFRDLTTYPGENFILNLGWGEDIDSPGITWKATLIREMELLSVAPLMQTSGLNRGFDIVNAYAPLLQPGRAMKVEYLLQAEDDPQAGTWKLAFTGYVDSTSWGDGDELEVDGRGEEAKAIDCYIERERIYAFATGTYATKGVYIYTPSTLYVVGDRVVPSNANLNDHFYRVTTGGTSAATEPTWPTGGGSTVTSGGATFTESGATTSSVGTDVETVMQQIIDDNLGAGAVTLNVPSSPSWAVKWFMVGRQALWDELRGLADQIGWGLRYLYDSGSNTMKLTLYDPVRSNTTSARTFSAAQTIVKRAQIQIFDIRNVVTVIYSDSQDLDASGFPKRKSVTVSDSASIAKYGRRFCEIAEASTSNIDTAAEALVLANSVLEDLREPEADFSAEVPLFPHVEVTDLYTLAANGIHFDVDEKLAVIGYDHAYSDEDSNSTFRMRGRPSTGASTWLQRCTDSYNGEVHASTSLDTSVAAGVTQGRPVGGVSGVIAWRGGKGNRQVQFELHVSTIDGFTPDPTTFKSISSEKGFSYSDLDPGKVYYGRHVPLAFNGTRIIRGQPSAQFTINPGRAKSTHLEPNVEWGRLPLNGGFETSFDPDFPPDFWFVDAGFSGLAGDWGETAFLLSDGDGLQGNNYIQLATLLFKAANLFSAEFSINEQLTAVASFWRKAVSGGSAPAYVGISWYDYSHAYLSSDEESFQLDDQVGDWVEHRMATLTPPSGARFAILYMRIDNGAGQEAHFDNVRFTPAGDGGSSGDTDTFETVQFVQSDTDPGPYTQPTFTVAGGLTVSGLSLVKTENITTPGDVVFEAIDISQWSQSGTTVSLGYVSGLTIGVEFKLTVRVSYEP